jgi:hypothetical protein
LAPLIGADLDDDEHSGARHESFVAGEKRDLAFEDVEAFFLSAVDVRRRPTAWQHDCFHKAYLPFVSSPVARKRYTSPTTAMVRPSLGFLIMGGVMVASLLLCGSNR